MWTHDSGYWAWGPWVASIVGGVVGAGLYDVCIYTGVDSPVNRPKRGRGGYGALQVQSDEEEGEEEV